MKNRRGDDSSISRFNREHSANYYSVPQYRIKKRNMASCLQIGARGGQQPRASNLHELWPAAATSILEQQKQIIPRNVGEDAIFAAAGQGRVRESGRCSDGAATTVQFGSSDSPLRTASAVRLQSSQNFPLPPSLSFLLALVPHGAPAFPSLKSPFTPSWALLYWTFI